MKIKSKKKCKDLNNRKDKDKSFEIQIVPYHPSQCDLVRFEEQIFNVNFILSSLWVISILKFTYHQYFFSHIYLQADPSNFSSIQSKS